MIIYDNLFFFSVPVVRFSLCKVADAEFIGYAGRKADQAYPVRAGLENLFFSI